MSTPLAANQAGIHERTDLQSTRFDQSTYATIMMVDDEPTTMELVQAFLEDSGYRKFVLVEDPLRAMAAMEEERPDILLLDLVMPDKTGFEILTEVRLHADFQHLPVVVLTSSTDTETKLRALDLGATDFLAKPVDPSELILRVRNTLKVKAYQDQLAYYDPLTDLLNRRMFMRKLDSSFKRAERTREKFALLNIEIDQFDKLSDTLGIRIADEVLIHVARRIQSVVRDADDLARLTTDCDPQVELSRFESGEFSLLLYAIREMEDAAIVADRIRSGLKKAIKISGTEIHTTASIGIAGYPNDNLDSAGLLKQATSAKDFLRGLGGDGFQFASKEINRRYAKRNTMESKLRQAIKNDELVLHFQPKLDVATNRVTGAESLLRWKTRELGPVSPIEFITLAEETGLIIDIGRWVLEQACQTLKGWQSRFEADLNLAVNLSARQFHDKGFMDMIIRTIHDSGVDPKGLTLELTESLLIDNVEQCLLKLSNLRDTGARLSVDDFGTGYSSLSYLQRLPVDELKIDQSFVAGLDQSKPSRAIASSVIFMSHNLGLKTVAEGVETEGQLEFLRSHECDTYQGYLFSRPLARSDVEDIFRAAAAS